MERVRCNTELFTSKILFFYRPSFWGQYSVSPFLKCVGGIFFILVIAQSVLWSHLRFCHYNHYTYK